ncbi:YbaB/EbfC family nucleoid-associated protein [Amycolatopsis sp. NPDC052450]|uniref:YbaB/EbfC family nucleoid-associated protein n=1 Tax=Amycolatopsis sp. NPDC052450 TaxID=3363937 RepID=UPI0037CA4325
MTVPQDPRAFRDQARAMESRLDQATHAARSADQAVIATVTGRGRLVDLRIADNALDRAHPQLLGASIVQAVQAARGVAHSAAAPELAALLGNKPASAYLPADRAIPGSAQPTPAGPRRSRSVRDEAPYEESFDQVDFLSDDDPDDQGGRR